MQEGEVMNNVATEKHLDRLMTRRQQLLLTLRHLAREQTDVENNTDWLDHAAYVNRVALLDRLNEGYQSEIQQLDRALDRMKSNLYGQCLGCHAPIENQRLEALPEAEFCGGCQEMREGLTRV
jgi:RNA polymerase-binding transcription factor DksA